MVTSARTQLLGHLRHLMPSADGELLRRFVAHGDEAAFAALVRRHGPMVFGVCRRLLRHEQDAEDAFQATFLVLARRAGALSDPSGVGSWLYGVAYRTALKARALARKRRAKEAQMGTRPRPSHDAESWADLESALDAELNRLPDAHRRAVVLRDLEGVSRRDAAVRLGVSEAALSGQLFRGRRLLAERLRRHGLTLGGAALGALLAGGKACAAPPLSLVQSTLSGAAAVAAGLPPPGGVSPNVLTLTSGVLKAMYARKLLTATAALALTLAAALTWSAFTSQAAAPQQPPPKEDRPAVVAKDKDDGGPIDVMLLQERKVVRELKCTDAQWDKIDDAIEAAMEKMQAVALNPAGGQPGDFEKGMKEILAAASKEVREKILTPGQVKRLRQIELQAMGAHAFATPRVEAALKLTDKQRADVKEQLDKAGQTVQDMLQNAINPPNPALLNPKALQAPFDVAAKAIQDSLTPEQRKLWREIAGDPLRFQLNRAQGFGGGMPFGFGIAGGGFGAGGAVFPPAGGIPNGAPGAVPPGGKE